MEFGEFHWRDGITFKRIGGIEPEPEFGTVRLRIYRDTKCESSDGFRELLINPWEWCSITASVSIHGETGFTYEIAKALHGVNYPPRREAKR